ncbi:MAG TPA: GNAT family N-acetyltransferase [Pirellulales bacterium]|nr:GNAT family N-acetyltransferase [Pirellulales bacterium]
MQIRTTTPLQLTSDEIGAWTTMQRANPMLASPYFCAEFTQATALARHDVEVAVLEIGGRPVGFFPYQRSRWNVGRSVAGRLSDFQAMICYPGLQYDPAAVLRGCGLSAWHFDHLLDPQRNFQDFVWRDADSPHIVLGTGIEDYFEGQKNGKSLRSEYGQRKRKIEREVGPLRLETDVTDRSIIATCFRWKVEQYLRTGTPNVFAYRWVLDLFDAILSLRNDNFSSMVSVLYAGSTIAAVNFCLRSRDILHAWFPAYNMDLARYSPGTLQWFEMIDALPKLGFRRIDLGKGPEQFKRRFMNGAVRVAEGTVDLRPMQLLFRRVWQRARDRIRDSRLYGPARTPAAFLYRLNHWLEHRYVRSSRGTLTK